MKLHQEAQSVVALESSASTLTYPSPRSTFTAAQRCHPLHRFTYSDNCRAELTVRATSCGPTSRDQSERRQPD